MDNLSSYDVEGEIRKAKQWILDNPRKRKSPKGMHKFISSWIMRSEETGCVTVDPEKSQAELIYEKNVREKIELFSNVIHERTKKELRSNKGFMYAYNTYPEFREWVGNQTFKAGNPPPPEPVKPDITEDLPPPVDKMDKIRQFVGDVRQAKADGRIEAMVQKYQLF
jgi:hypothetical protein